MISADIVCDSLSPCEKRITTFSLVYPRFILSELNTHRLFSRSSASSRAIPTWKLLEEIKNNPAMPVHFGKNKSGMSADEELPVSVRNYASNIWRHAMFDAMESAEKISALGCHKQVVNRILEPFMHAKTVLTSTEFGNFFKLRRHKDAQPEIKALADAMFEAMEISVPKELAHNEWHLPFAREKDDFYGSVASCARTSYQNHHGTYDKEKDKMLVKRLEESGHWSPFEHQAMAMSYKKKSNNFVGWKQLREILERQENGFRLS